MSIDIACPSRSRDSHLDANASTLTLYSHSECHLYALSEHANSSTNAQERSCAGENVKHFLHLAPRGANRLQSSKGFSRSYRPLTGQDIPDERGMNVTFCHLWGLRGSQKMPLQTTQSNLKQAFLFRGRSCRHKYYRQNECSKPKFLPCTEPATRKHYLSAVRPKES